MNLLGVLLLGVLVGSIPTGYLCGRLVRGIDIRRFGSGNPGATNVFRLMGRTAGTVVLLIDVAKGVVPVYLAGWWLGSGGAQVLAGIGAIAGHVFTPFLGFRGGKGVATGAGVFLALAPLAFLTGFCVWGLLVLLTRYVSVGSIGAAVATPLFLLWQRTFLQPELSPAVVSFGFLAGLLIVLRHIPNLRRLAGGTENRIGRKQVSESGKG